MPKQKETIVGDTVKTEKAMNLDEIGDPGPVEKVSETDFVKEAEMEAFMNEIVTIVVHESIKEGENEIITPSVNGVNQGIIRGKPIKVKRKYVEALARGRTTAYEQEVPDPRNPANIQMVPKVAHTYPFTVLNDPNPNGRVWLDAINAQP